MLKKKVPTKIIKVEGQLLSIFLISIFSVLHLYAQQDSVQAVTRQKYRIGIDPIKIPALIFGANSFQRFELNSSYNVFRNFHLTLDIGISERENIRKNETMESFAKGYYAKCGADYSYFSSKYFEGLFGLRIAYTLFNNKNTIIIKDEIFEGEERYVSKSNVNAASWLEFTTTFRVNAARNIVIKNDRLSFGIVPKLRIKTYLYEENPALIVYHIPGYGGNDPFLPVINFEANYHF